MSAGRKRDPIWTCFNELSVAEGKKGSRAKCKDCGAELQGLVARMKEHNRKCSSNEHGDSKTDSNNDNTNSTTLPHHNTPQSQLSSCLSTSGKLLTDSQVVDQTGASCSSANTGRDVCPISTASASGSGTGTYVETAHGVATSKKVIRLDSM